VPRDQSSSHRRYASETVDTLEALACLRSTGMTIRDMRAYLGGVAEGRTAAPRTVELFAGHAQRLEDELAALRVRHAYATAKAALWQARADGSKAAEQRAAAEVVRVMPRYAELLLDVATKMLAPA
jgi:DNA-binding transcriptional MerR regulator